MAVARRKRRGSYWQDVVLVRVRLAQHDLDHVLASWQQAEQPGVAEERFAENVTVLLDRAEEAASDGNKGWARLNGRRVSQAFVNLHAAEVLIARHAPDDQVEDRLLTALARVRATMSAREPRRRDLERQLEVETDAASRRHLLATALDWSYSSADALYARLRSFRNMLYAVAAALTVLGVALALVGWSEPDLLRICFLENQRQVCPGGPEPQAADIALIELLGASGGALAAVVAVTQMKGTQTPYDVPFVLAVLKLPLGAVSAVIGLLLIHGRFVPGLTDLDTSGQILAYAVFFGIAQQLATLFVDRRGQELLNQIPSKKMADQTRRDGVSNGDAPPTPDEPDGHQRG